MIGNWARIMAGWGWPNNQRAVVCLFTASLSVYSSINLPSESIFFFAKNLFLRAYNKGHISWHAHHLINRDLCNNILNSFSHQI